MFAIIFCVETFGISLPFYLFNILNNSSYLLLMYFVISVIKFVVLSYFSLVYYKAVVRYKSQSDISKAENDLGFNLGAGLLISEGMLQFTFPFIIYSFDFTDPGDIATIGVSIYSNLFFFYVIWGVKSSQFLYGITIFFLKTL
ncbi:MAG: hypothetical protein EAX96_04525 [Candidatus Lokiarchaeota archaeon]|nr:hypothetical protein [Candidatus Lokiarchaeota archaeon]